MSCDSGAVGFGALTINGGKLTMHRVCFMMG